MNNIEFIKTQLEVLNSAVKELNEPSNYMFTEEQMTAFIKQWHERFMSEVKRNVRDYEFSEDMVELELSYDHRIEISVNSHDVAQQVENALEEMEWDDHSQIKDEIDDIYVKIKQNEK